MHLEKTTFAIIATVWLAACATQPDTPEPPGQYLLVRDPSGKLLMQFDYPGDALCARTSKAMRGSIYKAGCATASAAEPLHGHATLRYNPPGVLVQAHYLDLAACQSQIRQLSAGVELVQACRSD